MNWNKLLIFSFLLFTFSMVFSACFQVECKGIYCKNGGECNDEGDCVCPPGYYAFRCETLWIDNLAHTYMVDDFCQPAGNFQSEIIKVDLLNGRLTNLGGRGFDVDIELTGAERFTIPLHTFGTDQVEGRGSFIEGSLSVEYTLRQKITTQNVLTFNCRSIYNKL